ncbi:GntR family transcriptional regulator [Aureimonas populi]|uniref:GntR family transcriptional regulator n=1 Tax=Aureimonas populi TaxID=1701758 RepID=A0ABW5CQA6_9HYPH|nr:GntR family transcriptional regulator [Aureimonas populi]
MSDTLAGEEAPQKAKARKGIRGRKPARSSAPRASSSGAGGADEAVRQPGTTLAGFLHQKLETEIVNGALKPGDRLDEQEIAQRFGMSRTPVREAFRLLGANELVELRGRQGVVVRKIGVSVLIEMFQVMAELEGLCARLAARRASRQQEELLLQVHRRLAQMANHSEADVAAFYAANQEFHEIIYDASRNGYLAEQTRQLRNRVSPFRRRVTALPRRFEKTINEHEEIVRAICDRDADRAHTAMRDHVNLLGDDLTDFIASYE